MTDQSPDMLVIGAGEVGAALAEVLDCDLRDIEPHDELLDRYEILHIAYPWSPDFIDNTLSYQYEYRPDYVVVHSTVPVGTCDRHGWVHSPVRGKHPDLAEGLQTFDKHFGGTYAVEAAELWDQAALSLSRTHEKAATTEAAKLFELAQYGMEIIMQKEIHEFCEEHDLPFGEVYTSFGTSYNDGWVALGELQFTKPILHHTPGAIGGHCVIQNTALLPPWGFPDYVITTNESFK